MRFAKYLVGLTGLLTVPATAQADRALWREASTKHFVVYARETEARVRNLATELELFDGMMRSLHAAPDDPALHSNRVTVYVADDVAAVQKLCGNCPNVFGFYIPRAGGTVAFTPRVAESDKVATDTTGSRLSTGSIDVGLRPRPVLFHEYGHHFLLGNYAAAYPSWFVEGYAEFVSTTSFTPDTLQVGAAPAHRGYSLHGGMRVPIRRLFDRSGKSAAGETDAVYARGWVLTHYIMFDRAMRAKFDLYMKALNQGTPSLAAAETAFGDLSELDQAMDRYMNARRLKVFNMNRSALPQPDVTLRALGTGEAALIEARMQSARGTNEKTAKPLFAQASVLAAAHPSDAIAQGWLAEMAFDAGDYAAAEAAADRALAIDPKSIQALLYKGRAGLERAAAAKAGPADWAAARRWIVQANKADPNHAAPLVAYYNSFLRERRPPTDAAIAGLHRAHELVPQDATVRLNSAVLRVREGKLGQAKRQLAPLAFDPHRPNALAARLLGALETAPDQAAAVAALEAIERDPVSKETAN